ncbi:RNA polymerase sigma factor [Lysinibacter cavernae]|uniref:RNA polymerase sigma factor (Sigma-70 family) n=1 Tax=Lysinibacter cavernae TaxID=1640652 RepID=A0A7X5R1R3_9MICO|nr:sigma-70 family RNA polymerase sigma factor [Lysinibacter cavernae]NIH54004.1 RNA polymerase sigma factor (sigma-70 family) [Lysinibacter cavernae]
MLNDEHESGPAQLARRRAEDLELIGRYRNGENHAAAELYERHMTDALWVARSLTSNASLAEEFASEAFTRVLEALRNGNGPTEDFRFYLRTAVRSVHAKWYQRNGSSLSVDDIENYVVETSPEPDRSLLAVDNEIVHAFQRLPDRWQQALMLRVVEGRKTAECARIMGVAPGAMSVLYRRAREGLRKEYLEEIAQVSIERSCTRFAGPLAQLAIGSIKGSARRAVEVHLDSCVDCADCLVELRGLVQGFNKAAVASSIAGIVGGGVAAGNAGGGSAAASLFSTQGISHALSGFALSSGSVSLYLAALSSAAVLGIAASVGVAAAQGAYDSNRVSVPVPSGECAVELRVQDGASNAPVFVSRNTTGADCWVSYSLNGTELIHRQRVDHGQAFIVSRAGTYTVVVEFGEVSKQDRFTL